MYKKIRSTFTLILGIVAVGLFQPVNADWTFNSGGGVSALSHGSYHGRGRPGRPAGPWGRRAGPYLAWHKGAAALEQPQLPGASLRGWIAGITRSGSDTQRTSPPGNPADPLLWT